MASNSVNLAFGAFKIGSSSGVQQDERLVVPVTSPVHVGLGQFNVMSSSVDGASSENHYRLGGFGELSHIGSVPQNQFGYGIIGTPICYSLSEDGVTQNLIESINFGTRTSSSPSSGGITRNLIDLIDSKTRTSYASVTAGLNQNLINLDNYNIRSSSGCHISYAPGSESSKVSSGFGIMSPHHCIGGVPGNYSMSNGLSGSTIGSSSTPYINATSILCASEPAPNISFGLNGSENVSSFINHQNYITSHNCEIYYGSESLRIHPSRVMQQNRDTNGFNVRGTSENNSELHSFRISSLTTQYNNVPIFNNNHGFHFELGSNQPNSFSVRGQNIHPRRGRPRMGRPQIRSGSKWGGARSLTQGHPQTHFGVNRSGSGSSAQGIHSTRFNQDLGTSANRSTTGHVMPESVSSRQPIRVNEYFAGQKRLQIKMAEIEDWTEDEIAIVEQAIKIPCTLTRLAWLSWISGLLRTKTALDVAVFLKHFMIERNAKRIRVDQNITSTGNNIQQWVVKLASYYSQPVQCLLYQ